MDICLPWQNGDLRLTDNKRFLCHENGAPLFWLGDTGWLLFGRLNKEEAETYLEDRKRKGFNVIQVMVLHHLIPANVYNKLAFDDFKNTDWSKVLGKPYNSNSDGYWDHMEYIVDLAAEKGLYMAMVPIWGAVVDRLNLEGSDVYDYAKSLALRYKDKPNIIWLNGGDIKGTEHKEVWLTIGSIIKKFAPNHLMTFHPMGHTQSSTWFHNEAWLDFNMFQSGHSRYDQQHLHQQENTHMNDEDWKGEDNWKYVQIDYLKEPRKPTIDGEPSYEGLPHGLTNPREPYWTADDCRRYAYWAVFAGAFGHTYGNNAIMQFHKPEYGKGVFCVRSYWYESISDIGGYQMQYLKRLMLSLPFSTRIPDQSIIAGENGEKYNRLIATRGDDYILVYAYSAGQIAINMGKISGDRVDAWWYNPRDGETDYIGSLNNTGIQEFNAPGKHCPGNDWVLVLRDSKPTKWALA